MNSPKILPLQPHTRDSLRALEPETLIDLYLSLDAKYQHLGDYVRQLVTEKYGKKNERFENPEQLQVFPNEDAQASVSPTADQQGADPAPDTSLDNQSKRSPVTVAIQNLTISREYR